MSRTISSDFVLLSILIISGILVCAAAPASGQTQTPATSAPAPTTTAQNSDQPPVAPAVPSDPSSTTIAKKPKRVWTNENMADATGTISVVGDGHAGKGKNSPQTPADPQYIAKTKKDLQKLQEQIDDANKQLATLKSFSEGEPVGNGTQEFHKGYNNEPIEEQRLNLEAKKKDLQAKIDNLLDEARKKGVEPGQLRQ
jgi:hypothetical protein